MSERRRKVALITGCSEPESLGAQTALELQSRGYQVFATARSISTMTHLEKQGCDILELDVTSDQSIRAACSRVCELSGGRLDILVNNAGVAGTAPILDTDPDKLRAMYEVNVIGVLRTTQAFAPLLVNTANKEVDGHRPSHTVILNIGSVACHSMPWLGAYGSSKAASQSISDCLRYEMANLNVRVITLELAQVHTAMSTNQKVFELISQNPSGYYSNFSQIQTANRKDAHVRLAKGMKSPEAARLVADLLLRKSPPGKAWIGSSSWMFKWFWPFMPGVLVDRIWRKMLRTDGVAKPVVQ